jgi:hypothetical protein
MARTLDEVLEEARLRPNPQTFGNGILYRADIMELLEGLEEPERHTQFLTLINKAEFISPQDKLKIQTDYLSYGRRQDS